MVGTVPILIVADIDLFFLLFGVQSLGCRSSIEAALPFENAVP